ncbi:MAG: NAD(P)-binding domain-containing protein [Pirellulaceae bacterium]
MPESKVCVVGAGCCGLAASKILNERGIPFDCFEKGSGIGGMWRFNNDNGMSAAYQSLHINTSRDTMAFSDFPMPRGYPDFPHHSLILKYFESYVDHFDFRDKLSFQTSVQWIQPRTDGAYDVITEDRNGRQRTRTYAAVLVANGHHWKPRVPTFDGQYTGRSLHSHDYREPSAMVGKRVLVVGIGNSGCDLACEISRVAESTYLSTRRGAHIIPKYLFGKPLDRVAPTWFWRYLPFRVFQMLFAATLRLSRGRQKRFGLPTPGHKILQEHPTISSDLLNLIGHGRIEIKPNVRELDGTDVHFVDGTSDQIDVIVYATGYDIVFPFLDQDVFCPKGNDTQLFKHVVHPDQPNLFFIGLIQPWGAIMPLAEQQAEWVADLVEQRAGLPSRDSMFVDIEKQRKKMQRRYVTAARHTIQVDFYPYLDELTRVRKRGKKWVSRYPSTPVRTVRRRAA